MPCKCKAFCPSELMSVSNEVAQHPGNRGFQGAALGQNTDSGLGKLVLTELQKKCQPSSLADTIAFSCLPSHLAGE